MNTRNLMITLCWLLVRNGMAGETLESVETMICDRWEKFKSARYDLRAEVEGSFSLGTTKSTSAGRVEILRDSAHLLVRTENTISGIFIFANKTEQKTGESTTTVRDREHVYTLTRTGKSMSALQQPIETHPEKFGRDLFRKLHETYELSVIPDELIDKKPVFVIEAKSKQGNDTLRVFFSKEYGIRLKTVTIEKTATSSLTIIETVSNLEIDVPIAAERFVFKAPEGVEITKSVRLTEPQQPAK